jgi:hypothetical protein
VADGVQVINPSQDGFPEYKRDQRRATLCKAEANSGFYLRAGKSAEK